MLRQLFRVVSLIVAGPCIAMAGAAQQVSAPEPQPATLTGTVLGADGGVVPGAKVVRDGTGADDRQTVVSGDDGSFQFANVRPGVAWRVTISATSFRHWTSNPITLSAGQHFILTGIQLRLATVKVSVNAITPEQAAAEQVRAQETQRVFGIVPNFYVVYERNHAPLTPKLKVQLAFKALDDPVSLTGFALNAGIYQMVVIRVTGVEWQAMASAWEQRSPGPIRMFWLQTQCSPRFCTRIHGTSIRVREQPDPAYSTHFRKQSSQPAMTGIARSTIRESEETSCPAQLRTRITHPATVAAPWW
jgi:hypothetical protein